MRSNSEKKQIETVRNSSLLEEQTLVLSNPRSREFFRFEEQELVEYDLTRANWLPVRLTKEELEVINNEL